jgi:hypothetical protein
MPTIPIIFLTPISNANISISNLAYACKNTMLPYLYSRIADEELRPNADNKTYTSKHLNWLLIPDPKIVTINSLGIETLRYKTTDYTLDAPNGTITFGSAVTDTVRASYNCLPLSDTQLIDITRKSFNEISSLIFRTIDANNIHPDYQVAICKRMYTNVLRVLLLEARDYFSVSVGGRAISKTNIVPQILEIINEHEKQLQEEINVLRSFNKTNRIMPTVSLTQALNSNAQIV